MTVTSFVRHTLPDYDQWRKIFDDFHESHGLEVPTVYRGVEDPSEITVVGSFDSLEEAQSFLNGAEVRESMAEAGVQNPQIWFAEETG
jgi:hypothetical protein